MIQLESSAAVFISMEENAAGGERPEKGAGGPVREESTGPVQSKGGAEIQVSPVQMRSSRPGELVGNILAVKTNYSLVFI